MSLTINYVVAHKLNKKQRNKVTTAQFSKDLLDSDDDIVVQMIREINSVYGRKQNYVQYGSFIETAYDTPNKFKKYFDKDGDKTDEFMIFTKGLMNNFKTAAASKNMATGGYIVFSDFMIAGVNHFIIAMVKDKSGISFDKNLKPKSIERIDLEKLHQAFRINFKSYSEFDEAKDEDKDKFNYLSFISKINQASDYFVDALSSQVGNSSSKATSELIDAIFKFSKNKLEEGFFKKSAREIKEDLCDYMHDIGDGNKINLDAVKVFLNNYVDPKSPQAEKAEDVLDEFITSLNSEKHVIPFEFAVSIKEVKIKGRVSIKSKRWDMKFDRKLLGGSVTDVIYYDKKSKKITVDVSSDATIVKQLESEVNELNSTD